jgi:Mce-associated membrane protein
LHPDSAVVLVFVDQTTASVQRKDPEKTKSAVLVTLTKVNGSWLIAKFDPVA